MKKKEGAADGVLGDGSFFFGREGEGRKNQLWRRGLLRSWRRVSEVKESGEVSTSATWRFFGSLFFGREGEGEAG